jgi:predicted transcriptional regulator of viral defense system
MQVRYQPFDYQCLKSLFAAYRFPRNKISKLLNRGEIIALKSGLYVLSKRYGQNLIPEQVANLLYGPSYVSLDYALSHYGLIPERAFQVTSVTTGRKKRFDTEVGSYTYQHLKPGYYSHSYMVQSGEGFSYLIATAEKALCDKLYLAPKLGDITCLEQYLFDDLRVDFRLLAGLDKALIQHLARISGKHNLRMLMEMMK